MRVRSPRCPGKTLLRMRAGKMPPKIMGRSAAVIPAPRGSSVVKGTRSWTAARMDCRAATRSPSAVRALVAEGPPAVGVYTSMR